MTPPVGDGILADNAELLCNRFVTTNLIRFQRKEVRLRAPAASVRSVPVARSTRFAHSSCVVHPPPSTAPPPRPCHPLATKKASSPLHLFTISITGKWCRYLPQVEQYCGRKALLEDSTPSTPCVLHPTRAPVFPR